MVGINCEKQPMGLDHYCVVDLTGKEAEKDCFTEEELIELRFCFSDHNSEETTNSKNSA